MKRKEILVLIGEVLGSRVVYSIASLVVTITMLSGITIILRNDIRDIKDYVQSVIDGDPNYKEVHEQVAGSENVIRGNIDIETLLVKTENDKKETDNIASNVNSGYDNYTATQTITDNSSDKPSNQVSNSYNGGATTVANNNNSNNSNNNINSNSTANGGSVNNNSGEPKKEEIIDRSSFNGKDIMISEGEPFNPMNGLQLAATDINGKNITNKIVIKENNVDTYKPGLYTVKATVELSDKSNLEKEFFVRVEPTVLNLAVNDVRTSKNILEKNEEFNLSFAVKSSKSYLEVASVNINNKDYTVNKISSSSFLRKSNKYEVNLVAPSKGGTEKIKIKSVTMSDGTIVDVDKSIEVEILRQEAQITDVVVKNISNENEKISIEYNLQDIDDTVEKAILYLYNENNIIIQREELEKNNKSNIDLNITENGNYKVEIKGYYKDNLNTASDLYSEKELFVENIEVSKFNDELLNKDEEVSMASIAYETESMLRMSISKNEGSYRKVNPNLVSVEGESEINGLDNEAPTQDIKIIGNVMDDKGNMPVTNFKVTVPTAANFTVNKSGNLIGPTLQVINEGRQEIEVYAKGFKKVGAGEIEIISENEVVTNDQLDRKSISLKLVGSEGTAYLSATKDGNGGVSEQISLNTLSESGVKLLTLQSGNETPQVKRIEIQGKAGINPITEPASDKFVLTLKIKKSVNE